VSRSIFGWSYPAGCSGPPDGDGPEECPSCGAPNADPETGDWSCAAAPGYCSEACSGLDRDRLRKEAEAEAAWAEHERSLSEGPDAPAEP
jgi:hypothetical protein